MSPTEFQRDLLNYAGFAHAKRMEKVLKTGKIDLNDGIPDAIRKNLLSSIKKVKNYTKDPSKVKVTYIEGTYFISVDKNVAYFQIIDLENKIAMVQGKRIKFDLTQSPEALYEKYFTKGKTSSLFNLFIDEAHALAFVPILIYSAIGFTLTAGCVMYCNKTGKFPGDLNGYLSHVTEIKDKCEEDKRLLYAGATESVDEALAAAGEIDKIMDEARAIFQKQGKFGTEFKDIYSCHQINWAHMSKMKIITEGLTSVLNNRTKQNEFVEKTQKACETYKETYSCLEDLNRIAESKGIVSDRNRRRYDGYLWGNYGGDYSDYVEDVRRAMKKATQQ